MIERIVVAAIILTMVVLIVRSLYRSWSGKDGGCAGCPGCAPKNDPENSRTTGDPK